MELNDLYFPVEKIPNPSLDDGVELPSKLQYAVQITKPDGQKRIVGYCSEIYHLVRNEDVIPAFISEISKYYEVTSSIKMRSWASFFTDFIIKDKSLQIMPGDDVFPRVRLINSYDGSYNYQFIAGIWRQICGNGLGVWETMTKKLKKMHTPSIGKEVSFEGVMEMASKFMAEIHEYVEPYHELADSPVPDVEARIEEVIEETGFPITLHEDVLFRAEEERARLAMNQVTDWLVYNAFNYQLNHNEDWKAKEVKKERIDQEVLNYLMNY